MDESARSERSKHRLNFILEGNLLNVILLITLPQAVTMLVDAVYNMADTYFVSQLGKNAISAVGINLSLMMIIRAVSLGFGIGSSSFMSRALGAQRNEDASRAAVTTVISAVAVVAVLSVAGLFALDPLVSFLGANLDSVRPFAIDYARWILIGAPVTSATVCFSQILRAEGSTAYAMVGSVSGCIINIVLDPLFISVLGFGVAGAAIAKLICNVISLVILLIPFIRKKSVTILKLSYFTPTKAIYSEIAKMGIPVMLRNGMASVSAIIINNVAASFGEVMLSAVSVSDRSARLVSSAIMGFGLGFQPIAGYNWGAKKYGRVLKSFKITLAIGAVIGTVLGASMAVLAEQVIGIFSAEQAVIETGAIFIRTQGIVLVPHVWVMILGAFFQAIGEPLRAGIMSLSRQLIALIPCVLVLSYIFGNDGLPYAQAASDIVSFAIALVLLIPMLKKIYALELSDTQ